MLGMSRGCVHAQTRVTVEGKNIQPQQGEIGQYFTDIYKRVPAAKPNSGALLLE
jgi:hypothetical protein